MIGRKFHFHDGEIGAALAVRVKTGSKQNKIDRVLKDGTVVLTIMNNPPDLNNEVIAYLAMQLGIEKERFDLAQELHVLDCIECGICSYVCLGNRNVVALVKLAKQKLQ